MEIFEKSFNNIETDFEDDNGLLRKKTQENRELV
jgi:hypothetical protein